MNEGHGEGQNDLRRAFAAHAHPVAVDNIVLHQHVAQVDADTEIHAAVIGKLGVTLCKLTLYLNCGIHRINHGGESVRLNRIKVALWSDGGGYASFEAGGVLLYGWYPLCAVC